MKKILIHIINMLLLSLLLISTTGITIHTHYCNSEHRKQQSFFEWNINCHHDSNNLCCENNHHENEKQSDCCTDHEQVYLLELNYDIPIHTAELAIPIIIVNDNTTSCALAEMQLNDSKNKPQYSFCVPPPPTGKQNVICLGKRKVDPLPGFKV